MPNSRWMFRTLIFLIIAGICAACSNTQRSDKQKKLNVLFIPIDDLNDWVEVLGDTQVKTPNIHRLAKQGMLFTNAHCTAPVCNASRSSILSGKRPSTLGIYNNGQPLIANYPDVVTIPRHFKNNGYKTYGGGKILHEAIGFAIPEDWDYYYLWHEPYREKGWWGGYSWPPMPEPNPRPSSAITEYIHRSFDWAPLDNPKEDFPDYRVASWASEFLKQPQTEPFFLAAGMFEPHIPWFVPREYFEMYNLEDIQLPPYLENDLSDIPSIGKKWAFEAYPLSNHHLFKELGIWKEAVMAYYAAITYSDAQVGRMLDALEASSYADNTIIVLWSDHGYHLGEKEHWMKQTLWERSTRVPFIIVAPGITKPGSVCHKPVSLLDIYPTLVELCDLPDRNDLEGTSLVPWLKNPMKEKDNPAITTRDNNNHAVRSENWRYISYNDGSEELYNHKEDPNEWNNLINDPQYKNIVQDHRKWLPKINNPDVLNFKFNEVIFDPVKYEWSTPKNKNIEDN